MFNKEREVTNGEFFNFWEKVYNLLIIRTAADINPELCDVTAMAIAESWFDGNIAEARRLWLWLVD